MANGLLKKLKPSGTTKLASIFLATGIMGIARTEPIEWGKFEDIVKRTDTLEPTGTTVNYSTSNINFTDFNGNSLVNNFVFSLVYFRGVDLGGGYISYNRVGGLNGIGNSATGYFNKDDANYWGMLDGQTANTSDNGRWRAFVDLNRDGNFGTYDSEDGMFDFDDNEEIQSLLVSGFQPFYTDQGIRYAGTITGQYDPTIVPEPSSTNLVITSLEASITGGGSNIITMTVFATSLATFSIQYKATPSASDWTALGTYAATGAVTTVADTNAAPVRFYKAVAP